jgi:gallate dioxygenase
MAELVCAIGVPHTPAFPRIVARDGPECSTARLYRAVREQLEAVQPDVIVIYDSDHLNTFFLQNLPTFAIGVAPQTEGPNDDNTGLPRVPVPSHEPLAQHLLTSSVNAGFDFSLSQHYSIDHSIMVPLHFVTPKLNVPVVPIFINGIVPPLPGAKRCFSLGEAIVEAIAKWPAGLRVAAIASGSFSLEVAGPMMEPGQNSGVPDLAWSHRVVKLLEAGKIDDLLQETTMEQLYRAGNVAGEILNWVAILGMVGKRKPSFIENHDDYGHAFGVWRWD